MEYATPARMSQLQPLRIGTYVIAIVDESITVCEGMRLAFSISRSTLR